MVTPRDFVREPATWAPIQIKGKATFRELVDVLGVHDRVPLVARDDDELGPYTSCIVVDEAEIETWCARGYRKLTPREDDLSWGDAANFDRATD